MIQKTIQQIVPSTSPFCPFLSTSDFKYSGTSEKVCFIGIFFNYDKIVIQKCEVLELFSLFQFSDGILLFCFIGIKPFQCDRCGKKFTRAYSLKMHRLKHEGKRCFRCQICSATFTSFGEYKHHMRVSRHIIRKPRIYECKTCGAMFTNSGNLIVHLRSLNHEASELANYFQSR